MNKKLHRHLKNIAASGGAKGGKARMEKIVGVEKRLFAIENAMKKYAGQPFKLWLARCSYRRHPYTVMGCALNPERQFREARKNFPAGAEVELVLVSAKALDPCRYIGYVRTLRKSLNITKTNWGCRALIQVAHGWPLVTSSAREMTQLSRAELDAWMAVRKPGRPPKQQGA
jgi:hypothetical protein